VPDIPQQGDASILAQARPQSFPAEHAREASTSRLRPYTYTQSAYPVQIQDYGLRLANLSKKRVIHPILPFIGSGSRFLRF
jgi:hypothetical protein